MQPATLPWFARHELRLFWRDWLSMLTAGRRVRGWVLIVVAAGFLYFIHLLAYVIIKPAVGNLVVLDEVTLVLVTCSIALSGAMMISQAMEAVTRAFYARADLDLILSSPAPARRLFVVRMVAIALSTTGLMSVLAGPFINVLAYFDGLQWLAAYAFIFGLGALTTAFAIILTISLFRSLGPERTRSISQIVSAVIGAAFVIAIQIAAIISSGSLSRLSLLRSEGLVSWAPDASSSVWWSARAAMGEPPYFTVFLVFSAAALAVVVARSSRKFGEHVIAALGTAERNKKERRRPPEFRAVSVKAALRRKEWTLLRRDPWLMSQTLMQILYLLPPALLLWRNFGDSAGALLILVPVLVMGAGQLAGGLAWLAVSGEDAPDLIASAPVAARTVIWAKIEAVLGAVAIVVLPLLAALALAAPQYAAAAGAGIVISACSGTMIQIWFRAQAKRSNFRRRHTSSRLATLAEALSSILWAGTAAVAALGSWFAIVPAVFALLTLACTWAIRPRQPVGT